MPASNTSRPFPRASLWWPISLFVITLAVYLSTLASGLVRGDGGELQYTLATLGVAHPTGYPLYSLLGWLWTKILPFGPVAWRVNLISAICGAAAVALVYGSVYRLVRRVLPALAGSLFLAFSPAFWLLSSVTEVYAPHALFVALVLYLLLVWRDAGPRRPRLLILVALVYGLSLSHHRTMLLLAPAMALFVFLESRPSGDPSRGRFAWPPVRYVLLLAAAFLAGLLPYLHVFIQQLRRGQTVQHVLWNVILGGDFAGFLGLRSDALRVIWELPRYEIGLLGLGLALAGLAWLAWRQRTAAWLLGVALAANWGFCLFYRVPDIEDFTLPSTLILAVLAGTSGGWIWSSKKTVTPQLLDATPGIEPGQEPIPSTSGRSLNSLAATLAEIALLLAALLSLRHLPEVKAGVTTRDNGVEAQARALLAYPFEPGAVAIADWDVAMAVRFLRSVEGAPQGVRVNAVRLGRERACNLLQDSLEAGEALYVVPPVQITRLPDGYQFSEAPPYVKIARGQPDVTRLERPLDPRLTLEGMSRQGQLLILRWLVTGAPLAEEYTTYAHYFDATGQPLGQQDKGMGAELSCWYRPTTWPTGQVIQDLYVLPPGTASVRVGYYAWRDGEIDQQGTDTTLTLP